MPDSSRAAIVLLGLIFALLLVNSIVAYVFLAQGSVYVAKEWHGIKGQLDPYLLVDVQTPISKFNRLSNDYTMLARELRQSNDLLRQRLNEVVAILTEPHSTVHERRRQAPDATPLDSMLDSLVHAAEIAEWLSSPRTLASVGAGVDNAGAVLGAVSSNHTVELLSDLSRAAVAEDLVPALREVLALAKKGLGRLESAGLQIQLQAPV